MQELMTELKQKIVAALNLQEVKPADIKDDEPLFGAGLGLDSIDALELVVMLERDYRIVIKEQTVARAAFASVRSLAAFVVEQHKK
ncbi:MAG: phosphopantetheine-binding protein [Verrucomicrobiia bacterium]|jgi:acyl carrier protein